MKKIASYLIIMIVGLAGGSLYGEELPFFPFMGGALKKLSASEVGMSYYSADQEEYVDVRFGDGNALENTLRPGKHHYLIALDDAYMIEYFSLEALVIEGTVSLAIADRIAKPQSMVWTPVGSEIPVEEFNYGVQDVPFESYARYMLITFNLEKVARVEDVSLYVRREGGGIPIVGEAFTVVGGLVALVNLAIPWAQGKITFLKTPFDNPDKFSPTGTYREASVLLANNEENPSMVLDLGAHYILDEVHMLAETPGPGNMRIEFSDTAYEEEGAYNYRERYLNRHLSWDFSERVQDGYEIELAGYGVASHQSLNIPLIEGAEKLTINVSDAPGRYMSVTWTPEEPNDMLLLSPIAPDAERPKLHIGLITVVEPDVVSE